MPDGQFARNLDQLMPKELEDALPEHPTLASARKMLDGIHCLWQPFSQGCKADSS